jgi:hypothetical protein
MNKAESKIISLLRDGDMLRFVLIPDMARGMDIHLEGDVAPEGDGLLRDRLEVAIREIRGQGYLFGNGEEPVGSGEKTPRNGKSASKAVWMEIRPEAREFNPVRRESVGFGSGEGESEAVGMRFPNLPGSPTGHLSDSLSSMIQGVRPIKRFELEFTRVDLPSDADSMLREWLNMHKAASQAFENGDRGVNLSEAFFSLWLAQKTGWQVSARALVSVGKKSSTAALEMIGREIFQCECRTSGLDSGDTVDYTLDLTNRFPQGWPFPAILPQADSSDTIAARRLHNLKLPRLPRRGLLIGAADDVKVLLPDDARDRHTYIAGATGTGKSTLLSRLIRDDIHAGKGVVLLDPHGDLFSEIADAIPAEREKDVFKVDPTKPDDCPGLNILDIPQGPLRERHTELLISELIQSFKEIWNNPEAFGPMFEVYFRNAFQLLTYQDKERCPNLSFYEQVFFDRDFRNLLLKHCIDQRTVRFWKRIAEKAGGEVSLENVAPYITSKISPLVQSPFLSKILTAAKDELNLGKRLNHSPILLVNLNKGLLGVQESRLLGVILMTKIMSAGLERSLISKRRRKPVNIYVDEFQNFVSDNMASMLSEARKFGLRLHLANQTLGQLRAGHGRQNLLESVLGNVGTMILFRLGVPDADRLSLFLEPFSRQEIQELPNFHALMRMTTGEGPIRPFIFKTLEPTEC